MPAAASSRSALNWLWRRLERDKAVGFVEHDVDFAAALVDGAQGVEIAGVEAAADVDDDDSERGCAAGVAAEVGGGHFAPAFALAFGGRGVAVARQIDEVAAVAESKIVQGLGAAWRVAGTGQFLVVGEGVDQARLAGVGAAGESGLGDAVRRQAAQVGARLDKMQSAEVDGGGELVGQGERGGGDGRFGCCQFNAIGWGPGCLVSSGA